MAKTVLVEYIPPKRRCAKCRRRKSESQFLAHSPHCNPCSKEVTFDFLVAVRKSEEAGRL